MKSAKGAPFASNLKVFLQLVAMPCNLLRVDEAPNYLKTVEKRSKCLRKMGLLIPKMSKNERPDARNTGAESLMHVLLAVEEEDSKLCLPCKNDDACSSSLLS